MKNTYNLNVLSILRCCAFICALLWQSAAIADVAVITNPAAGIGSITSGIVKSIYLGKLKFWPDGSTLKVVDQAPGSDARKLFLKKVVGKKERKFDAYWAKKAFSGKGKALKQLGDDADVKAWVSENKGSIGYIDASSVDESVKVLMIVK